MGPHSHGGLVGSLPGQKLVQKLVQTKFTVQELSISRKHDLSARTLVPGLLKGRPIAPLFSADLHTPQGPGGGRNLNSPGSEVSFRRALHSLDAFPAVRRRHTLVPFRRPFHSIRRNQFHWRVNSVGTLA